MRYERVNFDRPIFFYNYRFICIATFNLKPTEMFLYLKQYFAWTFISVLQTPVLKRPIVRYKDKSDVPFLCVDFRRKDRVP